MDDTDLLRLLREQPEEGLFELTRRYGALISAVVRRVLPRSPEDAEECAADTLVRIWRTSAALELCRGSLRPYVICTARCAAIDRYRALRRAGENPSTQLPEELAAPGGTAAEAEEAFGLETIEGIIRGMTPPDDEIFLRRFFLCETAGQIAKQLHMNEKAVESRLFRGTKKLRELLRKEGLRV